MADNVVFCSQCGAQSTGVAGFCQNCGARLVSGNAATMAGAGGVSSAAAPGYTAAQASQPYAGFWIRLVAYLVDNIVLGAALVPLFIIFCLPIIMSAVKNADRGFDQGPPPALFGLVFMLIPLVIIVEWLYEALLTSSRWQGTIGKRILRLKVTDDFGNKITFARSTGRFFAKMLSRMVMYAGFIMVAFMERKRGLHDIICSTQVLRY